MCQHDNPSQSIAREYVRRTARSVLHKRESGDISPPDLEEAVQQRFGWEISRLRVDRLPLSALLRNGEIVKWGAGPYTTYQAGVPVDITLADLVERAQDREVPTGQKETVDGRRGDDEADQRRHHYLTTSQVKDANTAARALGRFMDGPGPDGAPDAGMEEVARSFFVWDPEAGDWTKVLDKLRDACRAQGKSSSTTSKYVGALRNLLDLAATREWIARTEFHNPSWEKLPARWSETYETWRDRVKRIIRGGAGPVRELLFGLSRYGYAGDPAAASCPWKEVIPEIEAHWDGSDTGKSRRTKVRRAYRVLREDGLLSGPEWRPLKERRENATILIPEGARTTVARLYGKDGAQRAVAAAREGERVPWPDAWSSHEALVKGAGEPGYGLRDWALMRVGDLDALEELDTLPDERGGNRGRLRTGSLKRYLHDICFALGFWADECGLDWASQDLRAIVDRQRLADYRLFLKDETETSYSTQAGRLQTLGDLAATMARVARHRGDTERADDFAAAEDLLTGERSSDPDRSSYVSRLRERANEESGPNLEETRARARQIKNRWTNRTLDAEYAYDQMSRVGRFRLLQVVRDYGPLEKQVRLVVDQDAPPYHPEEVAGLDFEVRRPLGRRWAKEVRNLFLWNAQLVVPYRTGTLGALARQDLKPTHPDEPPTPPLQFEVHEHKRKAPNYTWHDPFLCEGSPSSFPAPLARLYLMPGGARDVLLTRPDGTRWRPEDGDRLRHEEEARWHEEEAPKRRGRPEPLYPNPLSKADYAWMNGSTVRRAIRNVPRKALEERPDLLGGVSYEALTEVPEDGESSVLIPHAFRHAFARWRFQEEGKEELGRVLEVLDHADASMLLKVYLGASAGDYPVGRVAAEDLNRRNVYDDLDDPRAA